MINLTPILDRRYEHLVLAVMLLALHFALRSNLGSPLAASMFTAHLGMFFIWQPIWQRDQLLDPVSFGLVVAFTGAMVIALNWWLMFVWLIALIGIVSGRNITSFSERFAYMITLAYLVSELLVTCVVGLFDVRNLSPAAVDMFRVMLIFLPFILVFVPIKSDQSNQSFPVDFFRAVNFSLMTGLLALSSVVVTYETAFDYPVALFSSLLALAGFLLLLGWLLSPRAGTANLFQLWERSLLNIGTPFEQWLARLAQTAENKDDPEVFLQAAIKQLVDIPFVVGAEWRVGARTETSGRPAYFKFDLNSKDFALSIYTHRSVGPTLLLHYKLLMQLIDYFYVAKLRGHEQAEQAQLQAVYETGARVTHDIKNLLQALQTLTKELQRRPVQDDTGAGEHQQRSKDLLMRQLPHINQRLQLALDKLQKPAHDSGIRGSMRSWWENLVERYRDRGYQFVASIKNDEIIPIECFDNVVENLLENAANKAKSEPGLQVAVSARADGAGIRLSVTDDGSPVDPAAAGRLVHQTVASKNGLGIGLLQAARLARAEGYELSLVNNSAGKVEFVLENSAGD